MNKKMELIKDEENNEIKQQLIYQKNKNFNIINNTKKKNNQENDIVTSQKIKQNYKKGDIIKLNIGGKLFQTTIDTLTKVYFFKKKKINC